MFGQDYITLEEAARRSGYHPVSLARLLRAGAIEGHKETVHGHYRWLVSARSLREYVETVVTFASDRRGPRLFLKRAKDEE